MKNPSESLRTWIEIDRSAIKHNYGVFRELIGSNVKLSGVVKSNAYGHDFMQFARELSVLSVDYLAVDSITEAKRLRKEGIEREVLVLGYTLPGNVLEAVEGDIEITASSIETLREYKEILEKEGEKLNIHIKIDTGMHRQGFLENDKEKLFELLKDDDTFIVRGVFTHFADAKDPSDTRLTEEQYERFKKWKKLFNEKDGDKILFHTSATGGTLVLPDAHEDMVRVGIGLYGHWPSAETRGAFEGKFELKPALTWKTIIGEIKDVAKGSGVGYGHTEILTRDSRIAICPIGYWHGFSRGLSQKGEVLVGGKRARVIGLVSMDMIAIDVTDIPKARQQSEVVLIGRQGKAEITAEEHATWDNTSPYESLTRLNPLIKRIYV